MHRLFVLALLPVVLGYPGGAPSGQCVDMNPIGHASAPQTSSPPFTIDVSSGSYTPGKNITVTIMSTNSQLNSSYYFRGFLIEARRAPSNSGDKTQAVGTFALHSNETELKTVACNNVATAAVTHTSNSNKTSKTFTWMAPPSSGDIYFKATIVHVKLTYWMNVTSVVITDQSTTATPEPEPTTVAAGEHIIPKTATIVSCIMLFTFFK